ncbi:TetR family transcriptional regulator [Haloactinopolyspora alba]|uniref:TetR family transcriptional regulator n=1 Tax=Haloactinopolyspora alba TaxID=648780 RepID=A0A2P8E2A7_9ACTN|nr:TetR/AcrR family transcriptional regulator [Haloactinopolyspora alba]PSL03537.1 TetR family transcriptional regulator [Haloactinopolyspora alba]
MPRPSSRERILDALQRTLIDHGPHAVTLEAVADVAGVSKGGLLYHFPTKEALITALARRLAEAAEAEFEQAVASGDVVSFFLRTSVPDSSDSALFWSLLAALRTNDVASDEARRLIIYCFVRWAEILHEHIGDPVDAEIVRLVGDGLYLSALTGLPMPDPELLEQVRVRLVDAVRSGSGTDVDR